MYERVLLPTDGSEGTTETLDHALAIAESEGATLHALYVVDRRLYMAAEHETEDEVIESLEAEGEAALAAVREGAADSDVPVETAILTGIPHREIVAYAEDVGADLVTMGTHGRTGRDRVANLGSVTDRVVESADVPVLVVDIGGE